jgi:hypothetical protein
MDLINKKPVYKNYTPELSPPEELLKANTMVNAKKTQSPDMSPPISVLKAKINADMMHSPDMPPPASKAKMNMGVVDPDELRIAIIVPYRDIHPSQKRASHLGQFISYMPSFMQNAIAKFNKNATFHIFIIEQSVEHKFNRGVLLNIGFDYAKQKGYNVFIFHDVDLLPGENISRYYVKNPVSPIHIARCWKRYKGQEYLGGIISISNKDYLKLNGYPNNYWGWGGEDDELRRRVNQINLNIEDPVEEDCEITDLEDMTLKEKLQVLKENEDWKNQKKWELKDEHAATWQMNGINTINDNKFVQASLETELNEFATKITFGLIYSEALMLGDEEEEEPTPDMNQLQKDKLLSKSQLNKIITNYLKMKFDKFQTSELEGRFGTRGKKLTKINYDNVIKKLLSLGFTTIDKNGSYRLSIQPQTLNTNTGVFQDTFVRIEIDNLVDIQKYCKTNQLSDIQSIKYNSKSPAIIPNTITETNPRGDMLYDALFKEFNFSVSYKIEKSISPKNEVLKNIIEGWNSIKKKFRYMNRITFNHPNFPFNIDLSITRMSNNNMATYTISESNVFNTMENYEIEFEVDNKVPQQKDELVNNIHKISKIILCGLQETNYPISFYEEREVIRAYMNILYPNKVFKFIGHKEFVFIGPSSFTLQRSNIIEDNKFSKEPNVRNNYTVTDKADGSRHLMFISNTGRIYLINHNMNVKFTGAITENKRLFNSIIDGELVLHNKTNTFINLFIAFDIYFKNNENLRMHPFFKLGIGGVEKGKNYKNSLVFRHDILNEVFTTLKPTSFNLKTSPMRFDVKEFYASNSSDSIFDCCKKIWEKKLMFEYNIDGLIFTPALLPVCSSVPGVEGVLEKKIWENSFKWKPAEYNTIDFLVRTQKDTANQDVVMSLFKDGVDASSQHQIVQYKQLTLMCGFNENIDGYNDACKDIMNDNLPTYVAGNKYNYKPKQFYPTNPSDNNAGLCNMILTNDSVSQSYKMYTEENEVFEDNTIVEFRFDKEKYDSNGGNPQLCWVPLRVRYDKTSELRRGGTNYGNSYKTANNNWLSIHNPITDEMITTGNNIVDVKNDDIYYNNATKSNVTKGLRDFHNLFVKKILITSVANDKDTLIDYACGKAGDLPKWIDANLSFVYGIDYSKDNLENNTNGACTRFLNSRKKYSEMPYALFVHGDSSKNIRNGLAMQNDVAKAITRIVFGQEEPTENTGPGVARQYNIGVDGFNISSCQFAVHYFFQNNNTFHNFMRNISECTKVDGYFIGTCYDGKTIFNKLNNTAKNESITFGENGVKILEIIKDYDITELVDDESCLGQQISVYNESINQLIPEYLVNMDYFIRIAENYGFVLLKPEECQALNPSLPSSTGMFRDLFNLMKNSSKHNKHKNDEYNDAINMSAPEKEASFLNRYFVFKKIRSVDAETISNQFMNKMDFEDQESVIGKRQLEVRDLGETLILNIEKEKAEAKAREEEANTNASSEKKATKRVKKTPTNKTKKIFPDLPMDVIIKEYEQPAPTAASADSAQNIDASVVFKDKPPVNLTGPLMQAFKNYPLNVKKEFIKLLVRQGILDSEIIDFSLPTRQEIKDDDLPKDSLSKEDALVYIKDVDNLNDAKLIQLYNVVERSHKNNTIVRNIYTSGMSVEAITYLLM